MWRISAARLFETDTSVIMTSATLANSANAQTAPQAGKSKSAGKPHSALRARRR
jgi:hypothetical protein